MFLIIAGAFAGVALAFIFGTRPVGWLALLVVPASATLYVNWWQSQNVEQIRSTSGLEYIFVPPIPLISALVTYGAIFFLKGWLETRDL